MVVKITFKWRDKPLQALLQKIFENSGHTILKLALSLANKKTEDRLPMCLLLVVIHANIIHLLTRRISEFLLLVHRAPIRS